MPDAPVCYYNKMSYGNSLEDCRRQHPKASEVRYYKGMCYLLQKEPIMLFIHAQPDIQALDQPKQVILYVESL